MIVDAHQHFIFPSRVHYPWLEGESSLPLRHDFTPRELRPELERHGVTHTVLVQTRHSLEETHEFLRIASETPFVAGVVGWLDLTDPKLEDTLSTLLETESGRWLKGVRHQLQEEVDPNWLSQANVQRGLQTVAGFGLVYDFVCSSREYRACFETAERHSNLRFVLDHLGKPNVVAGDMEQWLEDMRRFAALENVTVKISGLTTEADWQRWTPADLEPYVHGALEAFGAARCMYGSDYPVCLLAGRYGDTLELLDAVLTDENRAAVLAQTALRTYRLSEHP
jgi:L-fuconolactonase